MQNDKPVAFYSRKLNSAQKNYSTIEKELLSIVETLKEFHTMLYGCRELHVHTDHRNLTHHKITSQRVMRWRLFLEDYAPEFHYIKGEHNTLADSMSRLPHSERQSDKVVSQPSAPEASENLSSQKSNPDYVPDSFSICLDDDEMLDCFLNHPDVGPANPFPVDFKTIEDAQNRDAELQHNLQQQPTKFVRQAMADNTNLICYISQPNGPWRICIPNELLQHTVAWYHRILGHIGTTRLQATINQHFWHKDLKLQSDQYVALCDTCQRNKRSQRGYGDLPPRDPQVAPWQEVAADSIGPWTVYVQNQPYQFKALTIIDTVTNLAEIVRTQNTTAQHTAQRFEMAWLSRYPRPMQCIYDQGPEFSYHFQQMLNRHGIEKHPTSVKNPQANAICERLHLTIANIIRVLTQLNPPQTYQEATDLIDQALSTAQYAVRASVHSTLKATPGSIAFSRDMLLNIPLIADFEMLRQKRQALIDRNLIAANRKRISHDYQPGQQVLKAIYSPSKMQPSFEGPFDIIRAHTNGTITIRRANGVEERLNIQRVRPYRA